MDGDRITLRSPVRIDSWKAIATFLHRDERTVQRWEKDRLLPVHRIRGERGTVFAYESELLLWLHTSTAPQGIRNAFTLNGSAPSLAAAGRGIEDPPGSGNDRGAPVALPAVAGMSERRVRWLFWIAAITFVLFLLSADTYHARAGAASPSADESEQPATSATATARTVGNMPSERDLREAREDYLRGRFLWNRRTGDSLTESLDSFTQAIVHDPNYSPAYAGLAATYELLPQYSARPAAAAFPLAITAAKRAVALDPNSAEAHRVLGFGLFYWDWDASAAFAEFRRASELEPADAEAHHWYATSLLSLRRMSLAKAEIQRARELNPASRSILADAILIDFASGVDQADCLRRLRELERTEPDFIAPPRYLSAILLEKEDLDGWVAELKRIAATSHLPADLAMVQAAERSWKHRDRRALFLEILKTQTKLFDAGQASPYDLALTYLHLGDHKAAVQRLQQAYAGHDYLLMAFLYEPQSAALRGYQPFEELRQRVQTRTDRSN